MVCFYPLKFSLLNSFSIIFFYYVQVAQWQSVRLKTSRSLVQIQSWTKMVITIRNFFAALIVLDWFTFFHPTLEQFIFSDNLFFYVFFFFFFSKFFNIYKDEKFNFNVDLLYNFIILFLKIPSYFYNYSVLIMNKIVKFTINFKYFHHINVIKFIYLQFSKYFVIWRPLFKKLSYFGYYRSNRSKWIK